MLSRHAPFKPKTPPDFSEAGGIALCRWGAFVQYGMAAPLPDYRAVNAAPGTVPGMFDSAPLRVARVMFMQTTSLAPEVRAHRTPELEDWLNAAIVHPLAYRLARLLRPTGITPNMVSVLGVIVVILAAIVYTRVDWPTGAFAGFALHLFWHVVDGADGDLARLTGKTSANGEFVDGVCDYIGHIVLYITFAVALAPALGGWAWALIVAAGGAHIAQNNHHESLRRTYLWWAHGVPWLRQSDDLDDARLRETSWFGYVFGWMARDYLTLSAATAPTRSGIDDLITAASHDPALAARAQTIVRTEARGIMGYSVLLGSNARTVLLGLCMLADTPAAFFLLEITLLNLLLVFSIRKSRAAQQRAMNEIGRGTPGLEIEP